MRKKQEGGRMRVREDEGAVRSEPKGEPEGAQSQAGEGSRKTRAGLGLLEEPRKIPGVGDS
jgi:hypothetical protein